MSHTPGPWKVGDSDPFVYALNDAGTNRFFLQVQPGWITQGRVNRADDERTPVAEVMANARLIATAPELLVALKELLEVLHEGDPVWQRDDRHCILARSVIAKAEGLQQYPSEKP